MAIFDRLIERLLTWLMQLWGVGLTPSELQELQVESGLLPNIPVLFQILRRKLAAARFDAVLASFTPNKETTVGAFELYRLVRPPSLSWFVEQLNSSNAKSAQVSTTFRVSSPDNPDVYRDYSSFNEIPLEIQDERSGTFFKPDLNAVKVMARVRASGSVYVSARY